MNVSGSTVINAFNSVSDGCSVKRIPMDEGCTGIKAVYDGHAYVGPTVEDALIGVGYYDGGEA